MTFPKFEKQGTVDEELAAKLKSELEFEISKEDESGYPLSVKEFLDSSPFKIIDESGRELVQLVREFGDETVRVEFSIADISSQSGEGINDDAFWAEESEGAANAQAGGAHSKAGKSGTAVTAGSDNEGDDFEENEPSYPARVTVTVSKPNTGALQVEAIAQDGMIVIDNVFYHRTARLATEDSVEADWERRGSYGGPPFGNLDEDLQVIMERFLDERGINTALALFVPDYIDYKEQKEYIRWLKNVADFVQT